MHTTVSIPEDQVLYQEMQPLRVMSDVTCKKISDEHEKSACLSLEQEGE